MNVDPIVKALKRSREERLARLPPLRRLWTRFRELLPPYGVSSTTVLLGVRAYDRKHESHSWAFNALFDAIMWLRRQADDAYHWCHLRIVRYDVVRTDLGLRYAEVDTRMFFACFALLGEFVEHELGRLTDGQEGHRGYRLHRADEDDGSNPERKAIDLWLWYLGERARGFEPPLPAIVDMIAHDDLYDRRLRDLIDIRLSLWT